MAYPLSERKHNPLEIQKRRMAYPLSERKHNPLEIQKRLKFEVPTEATLSSP
jgi:hypothetical protein